MLTKIKQYFCKHEWYVTPPDGLISLNRTEFETFVVCGKCGIKGDHNSLTNEVTTRNGSRVIGKG
ncbi:hypothetical protein [Leuconostoc carnosum]|uniref:hypothetical protein n=1 Tax=Leuconostoc carnosum TaxID=1252 RepID=UPI0012392992|nr:hypothetical protein [Leuconostoc carnosum]KAA8372380.1 hypothetical protein FE412_07410 [Leuconostoc carnosum]